MKGAQMMGSLLKDKVDNYNKTLTKILNNKHPHRHNKHHRDQHLLHHHTIKSDFFYRYVNDFDKKVIIIIIKTTILREH